MGFPFKLVFLSSLAGAFLLHRLDPLGLPISSSWQAFLSLFFIQFVPYAIWVFVLYPTFFSPLRHLPQPPGASFLTGNLKDIRQLPTGHPQIDWAENVPNDGLVYYRMALNSERVLLTNAKALTEVLSTKSYEFVKPEQIRQGLGRILGMGILLAEGDEHKRQRKLLNPAFAFRHVKDLYPIFWAKGREMVIALEETISTPTSDGEKPTNVVEISRWFSRTTLDIIGVSGMGRDFNSLADPSNELYRTYTTIFSPRKVAKIMITLSFMLPMSILRLLPFQRNGDIQKATRVIKRTAYDLIQDKKAKLEKGESTDVDILSVALKSGGFSDDDLVNQLMTFLAAGHETTSSSMTWATHLLCLHPHVQTRLREEIRGSGLASTHDQGSTVTAADIENIPYLSAVCNEVLRFNPPVALTLRKALNDTTILGHPIPKDTTIIICPLANNLSKAMWGPDAREFNPDRWMNPGCQNSGGAKSNYSFMTFLHGPHGCIGSGFAKAEFMCLLAALVSSFKFELEDPDRVIEIGGGATSRPIGGLPIKITPVEG